MNQVKCLVRHLILFFAVFLFVSSLLAQNYFSRGYNLGECYEQGYSIGIVDGKIQVTGRSNCVGVPGLGGAFIQVDYDTGEPLISWTDPHLGPVKVQSSYVSSSNYTFLGSSVYTPFNGLYKLNSVGEVTENGFYPYENSELFNFFVNGNDSLLLVVL
jgi:hypothetical protein